MGIIYKIQLLIWPAPTVWNWYDFCDVILFMCKATPIGIPVSGPVHSERGMWANFVIMSLLLYY